LTKKDLPVLLNTSIYNPPSKTMASKILNSWWEWESALRNELAKLRGARLNIDPEKYLAEAGYFIDIPRISRHAMDEKSPLKAQHYLNKARWSYLELLKQSHFFDLDYLIIYYLQLQLLESRDKFIHEAGQENYRKTCGEILKDHEIY
jgi:hypothetical protein